MVIWWYVKNSKYTYIRLTFVLSTDGLSAVEFTGSFYPKNAYPIFIYHFVAFFFSFFSPLFHFLRMLPFRENWNFSFPPNLIIHAVCRSSPRIIFPICPGLLIMHAPMAPAFSPPVHGHVHWRQAPIHSSLSHPIPSISPPSFPYKKLLQKYQSCGRFLKKSELSLVFSTPNNPS